MQMNFEGTAAANRVLSLPANQGPSPSHQTSRTPLALLARQELLRSETSEIPVWAIIALAAVLALIASLKTSDSTQEVWPRIANSQVAVLPILESACNPLHAR